MKISNTTQAILRNFSDINKGILFSPGNVIRTRTPAIFAEATVSEEFPIEAGIFDLPQFLAALALFNDPDVEFGSDYATITDSSGRIDALYAYAGAGLVSLPLPKKRKEVPTDVIDFVLQEEQWMKILKAMSVFQKPEMKITSNGKVVRIGTANHKSDQGNSFSMILDGDAHGLSCNMIISREHLKLIKGSYVGTVTPAYTIFKNTSGYDLTYFVGTEPTRSKFGESTVAA